MSTLKQSMLLGLILPYFLLSATLAAPPDALALKLVAAAESQIGVTLYYDGSYQRLAYPNGDVPIERGVCTDVIIRTYRQLGLDLQQLVHDDMRVNFNAYPPLWGLSKPDRHIDHRRVPNLQSFFTRHGQSLSVSTDATAYHAGDLVTWMLPGNLPHIGIVSASKKASGVPLIVHNIGGGAQKENVLFLYPITGHYRYKAEALTE